jgi:hypothetical protein
MLKKRRDFSFMCDIFYAFGNSILLNALLVYRLRDDQFSVELKPDFETDELLNLL